MINLPLQAEIKPNALVFDGMVLQQKALVKIWGTATPNEKVTATFREQTVLTVTDADGRWSIQLQSGSAGGPFPMTLTGSNTINLPNVYVGEVWVLSGQSTWNTPFGTVSAERKLSPAQSIPN